MSEIENLENSNKTQEMYDFVINLISQLEKENTSYTVFLKPYPVLQEINQFREIVERPVTNVQLVLASNVLNVENFANYDSLGFWRVILNSKICFSGNSTMLLEATMLGVSTYTWETPKQIRQETPHFSEAYDHGLINFADQKDLSHTLRLNSDHSFIADRARKFLGLDNRTILELSF